MVTLASYPVATQATANSCWAAAGRSVVNWYHSLYGTASPPNYATDQDFADAWAAVTGNAVNADINVQQSAAAALGDLNFGNNTDDAAIPTPAEIWDAINQGMPLLAIVGDTIPNPSPDLAYQNGHWVVIVGITAQDPSATLQVFDPADGAIHNVSYSATTYQPGAYWQNTSYVDPYAIALPPQS